MKTITIEGREVTVYHKSMKTDGYEYVVYNEKIYQIIGRSGAGINHKITLEKESTGERITISTAKNHDLKYIVSNHCYMKI
jgi:hypothetical protein